MLVAYLFGSHARNIQTLQSDIDVAVLLSETPQKLLEYYLHLVDRLSKLLGDFRLSGAVERYLQVAIKCIIDIGNEIISSLQLKRPERYRDIPYILAEAKIIPKSFAEKMTLMVGFRNVLVHDYASINLKLVYEFLQTKLSDFAKYIVDWLEKR